MLIPPFLIKSMGFKGLRLMYQEKNEMATSDAWLRYLHASQDV